MPLIKVNLTDVDSSPPKFDPQIYDLEVTKVTYNPREGDKDPKLLLTFKEANAPEDDRRRITHRLDTEGDFRSYLKQFIECAGLDGDIQDLDTETLVGATVRALIVHVDTTDKATDEVTTYQNIKRFLKPE